MLIEMLKRRINIAPARYVHGDGVDGRRLGGSEVEIIEGTARGIVAWEFP